MEKGKLIVLESCDGAGKSTQIQLITKYFESANLKCVHEHFPKYGHNEFSDIIAKFLRGEFGGVNDVDPYFVANIYAMDRFMYLPTLLKQLEENDVVLLDRYVYSNIAFQCAKVKDNVERIKLLKWIEEFEFEFLKLPRPNLTLFLDVPIDVVKERLTDRKGEDREYLEGKQDIHEADLDFQSTVTDIYKGLSLILNKGLYSLSEDKNYHIVECVKNDKILTPEEIFNSYKSRINVLFM